MISITNNYLIEENIAYIITCEDQIKDLSLSDTESRYLEEMIKNKKKFIHINSFFKSSFIVFINDKKDQHAQLEEIRTHGHSITKILNDLKQNKLNIICLSDKKFCFALTEGIALSNYRFLKYFKDKDDKISSLKEIKIVDENISKSEIENLNSIVSGVFHARDIINEPLSYMTATKLAEEIVDLGKKYGFKTEILEKKQLESLKMGGLLAVNRGSIDPPSFSILKWEPENAINKKPIVLVGKGVVFDTGGINLKPSGHIETMKCDKAGAAAVIGAIVAISKSKLPINIIGLIPATDNRPGNNAYVPEDIVTMFDGTTVEVLNTDAEGRMILADALSYAKKFNPELVIDLATLTGAAVVALGDKTTAILGNSKADIDQLIDCGFDVWERLAQLPIWDDYADLIKSSVADLKNIGGRNAGTITAAKFLEHFTDYKWVHLDIAGPAFNEKEDSYRGNGGTGVGVRLLFNFLLKQIS